MHLSMDVKNRSEIPWTIDGFFSEPTKIPEIEEIDTGANEIGTLVIFVIAAISAIVTLFIIAIFIDCRQEKIIRQNEMKSRKKTLKVRLPKMTKRRQEDEETISDKMHDQEPTPSVSNIV